MEFAVAGPVQRESGGYRSRASAARERRLQAQSLRQGRAKGRGPAPEMRRRRGRPAKERTTQQEARERPRRVRGGKVNWLPASRACDEALRLGRFVQAAATGALPGRQVWPEAEAGGATDAPALGPGRSEARPAPGRRIQSGPSEPAHGRTPGWRVAAHGCLTRPGGVRPARVWCMRCQLCSGARSLANL